MNNPSEASSRSSLSDVAAVFLKLGVIAFGGPAAHIAMMRDEIVGRRKWMDDRRFLDLLGATNLIPGPNSTEMTIHIGYERAGWPGLITGGASFILPAMLIVTILSWVYVTYGSAPAAGWLLYGVKPVIIAVILQAIWALGRRAVKTWWMALIGAVVLGLYFLGIDTLALLFGGAILVMIIENARRLREQPGALLWFGGGARGLSPLRLMWVIPAAAAAPFSVGVLFLTFLKIGAVLYGGGYTLLAFLQDDFVDRLGWLTHSQLIDAVAIGQVTPGPLFTTATFIGFVLAYNASGGSIPAAVGGGVVATLGIFLPSFIFVALTHRLIPRMRASKWASSFLDGANIAAVGLMAAVTIELARSAFVDPLTVGLGLVAAVILVRWNVNSFWLVLGGAVVGAGVGWFGG